MAERVERVKQLNPLAVIDYILEEILALPGLSDILPPTPKEVLTALGLPTLDEVAQEVRERIQTKIREKVR